MRSFWTQECPWDRNGLCQVPSLTDKVRVRESISQMKNGNALVPSPLLQKQPLEVFFNPIQDELFRGCSRMAGGQKGPPSLRSVTHIRQWWKLAQLYLTRRRSKKYMNHVTHPWVLLTSAFFHQKSANFAISRNTDIDCILIHNFYLF